ncbi:GNAT family N-acetyltransferase [Microbacterium halophytorum]|uniref:GNAT family N-acetyltransferase n=1 Tax=Microbacterium halophytorum TaxID=2067568 RepID=UPI001E573B35|nr:GNAT family N-acetyltransferase [Microbacterium halophytorum]
MEGDDGAAELTMRAVTPGDADILREATLRNMNWSGERFTMDDIRSRPEFARYSALVPERGDFGIVAEDDAGWVCVAWLLFLDASDPGYGYVRDGVPELSICTREGMRGRGHGRRVIERAIRQARFHGVEAISLSVEPGNAARHLYEAVGFVPAPQAADEGAMILALKG